MSLLRIIGLFFFFLEEGEGGVNEGMGEDTYVRLFFFFFFLISYPFSRFNRGIDDGEDLPASFLARYIKI